MRWIRLATLATLVAAVAVTVGISSGATAAPIPDGDWLGFGRTPDNMRHSPLTEITPANAAQLGRAYTVDLKKIDPTIKIGEQSYPVAVDGQLYVTSNDDNVFRIDGATGKIVWQYKPGDSGRLQELRHRREPRSGVLRRQALLPDARHAHQRAEPGRRTPDQARHHREGRSRRRIQLRLLGDERAHLRRQPRDLRRRGLRVRHARVRDGVHDEPHAGLAEPVLDDSPELSRTGARRAGSREAATSGPRSRSTRRPTRCSSELAPRPRSTSRRCGPGRTRGQTR